MEITPELKKKELEEERDRIKAILARRAHQDKDVPGNYITDFPNIGDEEEEATQEFEQYEVDVDIEHVLERRLLTVEKELAELKKEISS